ncbi:anthranilate synthase component I family protein [Acidocella sp.]|uniref:anthranilate synthase component I family protein n=1 Tax=Acidocella sp. TaxID=50710 RepID=UPI00263336E5|nr:anthranilate synthase component I family protein [Acidocella sp.]
MLCREFAWIEPATAFQVLAAHAPLVFLDSAATGDPRATTSYLALEPRAVLRLNQAADLSLWLNTARPTDDTCPADWPFPFKGGAIGWLGYEAGMTQAGVRSRHSPVPGLPPGWFGMFDLVLGFDHASRRCLALAASRPGQSAEARLVALADRLTIPAKPFPVLPRLDWQPELSRAVYEAKVQRLRGYIASGDVYQANFTTRFISPRPPGFNAASCHAALRIRSPAPFAAFIETGEGVTLCGASPERFLRVGPTGRVETRPIKGTAPRHPDPARDKVSAAALHENPKERAENLMITDLLRNDLGQLCEIGSVQVPELFTVESFAQTHHLVSAVSGQLRPGVSAAELLLTCSPGGSITGAPKRRAMQVIDELEETARGAYCGNLAWIGLDGAMDSAIIIRTITATPDMLYAQAGGGITWDSNPESEYDEMMLKLSPLLAHD